MANTKASNVFEPGTAPHPSSCLKCGTYQRTLVDFSVTQPWNGAMLVCTECLRAIVIENQELLKFLDEVVAVGTYDSMLKELEDSKRLNKIQATKLTNFNTALSKFKEQFDASVASFNSNLSSGDNNPDKRPSALSSLDEAIEATRKTTLNFGS